MAEEVFRDLQGLPDRAGMPRRSRDPTERAANGRSARARRSQERAPRPARLAQAANRPGDGAASPAGGLGIAAGAGPQRRGCVLPGPDNGERRVPRPRPRPSLLRRSRAEPEGPRPGARSPRRHRPRTASGGWRATSPHQRCQPEASRAARRPGPLSLYAGRWRRRRHRDRFRAVPRCGHARGRVTVVEDFPEARKPAWKLTIDFGPEIGEKRSSAQQDYSREELEGRLVVGVVNFPRARSGPSARRCWCSVRSTTRRA